MDLFHGAKTVRLRSHHGKYLTAADDDKNVRQEPSGSSPASKWTVIPVDGKPHLIRLKNVNSLMYLSAYQDPHLLGLTGKRVVQASPRVKSDPCVEWEPVKEGGFVKLRAHHGTFLRANGNIPPWRNTITHIDRDSNNPEWSYWSVDVLDFDHSAAPSRVGSTVSSSYGGGRTESQAGSVRPLRSSSPEPEEEADKLSRTSSTSSTDEVSQAPTIFTKIKNTTSSKSSNPSSSFNKLDSVISEAEKLMSDRRSSKKPEPAEDEPPSQKSIQEAKHTLSEAIAHDFESMHKSGTLDSVTSAITVLLAHESSFGKSKTGNRTKLLNLKRQLEAVREEREKVGEEEEAIAGFVGRKEETKAELQREVERVKEKQRKEVEIVERVGELRRRREEIVREVERVEREIVEREEERVRNERDIEEVCGEVGRRSDGLKRMEMEEGEWGRRKVEAERVLREVEEGWGKVRVSLCQEV